MSVAAQKVPAPPATPPSARPPRAAPPPSPPPLATLLATRPERERVRPFLPLAGALLLHVLLLLLLLVLTPLRVEHPAAFVFPLPTAPREAPLITLLSPGETVGPKPPAGAAAPPAPAPAAGPAAPLSFPRAVPTELPPVPAAQPGEARPGAPREGTAGAGGAAEELRPPEGDARLFGERNPAAVAPMTDQQRLEARVQGRIDAVNDSILAAQGRAEKATDWTIKGKDGSEWGISPGKLHLGKLTLPLPIYFEPPPGKRDEAEKRLSEWTEINRAADAAHNRAIFKDRVKAIRERKEKEHAEQQKKKQEKSSSSSSESSS